jgi:hypothetical protein
MRLTKGNNRHHYQQRCQKGKENFDFHIVWGLW